MKLTEISREAHCLIFSLAPLPQKKKTQKRFASLANLRATVNIKKAQKVNQKEFNELRNYSNRNWVTFREKNCMCSQGLVTSISSVGWESVS